MSATLGLYFSAVRPGTLADLIEATRHPESMYHALQRTPYFQEHAWQVFERIRPDLLIVLTFLQTSDFEAEYEALAVPSMLYACHKIKHALTQFDLVGEVESELGRLLLDQRIEILVLAYTAPTVSSW